LRDYQPRNATVFLTKLAEKNMGLNGVNHVRSLMSGIFKHAAALGYVNANPIHLAKILVAPTAPKETPHYTILEMAAALSVLQGQPQARAAIALAFIGLHPSEIRGLRWEDVNLWCASCAPVRVAWQHQRWRKGQNQRARGHAWFNANWDIE